MHSMKLIMAALSACVLMACGGGGGGDASTAMAWQGAQLLEAGPPTITDLHVSINADGLGHAVWSQQIPGEDSLVFASAYRNGIWQPGQQISTSVAPVFASEAQVVTLPDGEALAVWQQGTTQGDRVAFSRTVNGVWMDAGLLQSNGGDEGTGLKMVSDGHGRAIAVWKGGTAVTQVRGAIFRNGAFGPVQNISGVQTDVLDIDVAIDDAGNALVVWAQHSAQAGVETVFSRAAVDGSWKDVLELNPNATKNAENPQVAVGLNGTASVVWEEDNDAKLNGRRATNFLTGQWAFTFLGLGASGGAGHVDVPQVLLDKAGITTVVWSHGTAGPQGVVRSLRSARGKGSDPFTFDKVELLESAEAQQMRAAIDANGRVMVVWSHEEIGGVRATALANVLDPASGRWGNPEPINDNTGHSGHFISLAMNARGQAISAWTTKPVANVRNAVANVFK